MEQEEKINSILRNDILNYIEKKLDEGFSIEVILNNIDSAKRLKKDEYNL
jgi:hypothetical protein